jgi:hypothetical protein
MSPCDYPSLVGSPSTIDMVASLQLLTARDVCRRFLDTRTRQDLARTWPRLRGAMGGPHCNRSLARVLFGVDVHDLDASIAQVGAQASLGQLTIEPDEPSPSSTRVQRLTRVLVGSLKPTPDPRTLQMELSQHWTKATQILEGEEVHVGLLVVAEVADLRVPIATFTLSSNDLNTATSTRASFEAGELSIRRPSVGPRCISVTVAACALPAAIRLSIPSPRGAF